MVSEEHQEEVDFQEEDSEEHQEVEAFQEEGLEEHLEVVEAAIND